jgi:hypothetical protein
VLSGTASIVCCENRVEHGNTLFCECLEFVVLKSAVHILLNTELKELTISIQYCVEKMLVALLHKKSPSTEPEILLIFYLRSDTFIQIVNGVKNKPYICDLHFIIFKYKVQRNQKLYG